MVSASSAGQPLRPPVEFDAPTHRLHQASGPYQRGRWPPRKPEAADNLRVKEVKISDAEQFVICSNPEQADP